MPGGGLWSAARSLRARVLLGGARPQGVVSAAAAAAQGTSAQGVFLRRGSVAAGEGGEWENGVPEQWIVDWSREVERMNSAEWVFEYMCQVLQSPTWEVPVMSFIDETCAIFDSEEENKLAHMDAHLDFKTLVEDLLTQHLAEVGIAPDHFYEACERAYKRKQNGDFATRIIEQLIACDDFLTFKAIMFKRNKELEIEALTALAGEGAVETDSADPESKCGVERGDGEEDDDSGEDHLGGEGELNAETERLKELTLLEKEQADLETAIALSLQIEEERLRQLRLESGEGKQGEEKQHDKEEKSAPRSTKSLLGTLPALGDTDTSLRKQMDALRQNKRVAEAVISNTGTSGAAAATRSTAQGYDEVDLARRKKHIEEQRQRLLAAKQKEREQQLKDFVEQKAHAHDRHAGPKASPRSPKTIPTSPGGVKKQLTAEQGQLTHALARRMKSDLLEATVEENGGSTFSSLDAKLKQVEQLRKERANLLKGL
jgi:hypothetical protein